MKTQTTEEAIALLKATRAPLIAAARAIADRQIRERGSTTTKEVMAEMNVPTSVDGRWLGAVFSSRKYRWTGKWSEGFNNPTTHPSSEGARLVKVWEFA